MVDTVCSRRETIRIAGDDYPAEVVKSRFLKLDSSHIASAIGRLLLSLFFGKRARTPWAVSSCG